MKNIYHRTFDGHGLSVAIDREGVFISRIENIEGLIDNPEKPYLITDCFFSWPQMRNKEYKGIYSGDTGKGKIKEQIVSRAISLMSYFGGLDTFVSSMEDFVPLED